MERAVVERCEELLEHRFQDPSLLELALTHASVATTRTLSNERLEFLGDAVLGLVVCHRLYDTHEDLSEGQMTKIKSLVVSRQTCAEVAESLGMCELLSLGKGVAQGGNVPLSVAAAVFESLIGALYLDGGSDAAQAFIVTHVQPYIDEALATEHQRNYKSMLQQYAQRTWNTTPDYVLLDEKGPAHARCFEVGVMINKRSFRSAWGMTKKEAEQEAARLALADLGLIDESEQEERANADN